MTTAFDDLAFDEAAFDTEVSGEHAFDGDAFDSSAFDTDDTTSLRGRLKKRWRGKLGYLGKPSPALEVIHEIAAKAAEQERTAEVNAKADQQRQKALKQALKEQGIAYEKQFTKLLAEYVALAREIAQEIEVERSAMLQAIEQARLAAIAQEDEEQQILLLLLEV